MNGAGINGGALAISLLAIALSSACGSGAFVSDAEIESCKAALKKGEEEGRAIGGDKTWADCLALTMKRTDHCSPDVLEAIPCRFAAEAFLKACLEVAKPSDGFCDGVPHPDRILKTVLYTVRLCEEADRPNLNACAKAIQPALEFCADLKEAER